MGAGHSHGTLKADLTPAQQRAQNQALRVLVMLLVPLAVLTLVGLVWLWPHNAESHIRNDTGTVRVAGTTIQVGEVVAIQETSCEGVVGTYPGDKSVCARVTAKVLDGPDAGSQQRFQVNSAIYEAGMGLGTKVTMTRVPVEQGKPIYQFQDFERSTPLVFFLVLFAALVVLVARLRGFLSLIGLGFGFFIMVQFMMPALIEGKDPLLVGIVGSAAIMFVVLYTSHGFTPRTTTALVGTLFGLLLSAVMGVWATRWARLSGMVEENDFMLVASAPDLKLTSVVVVSMIVAALGALNDVTITQASSVWELARTERRPLELYRSAMRIGRDHIASTVYTIAFAAAGGAMTVLLLIQVYDQNLGQTLVQELFAGEILRTIIGSVGLVLAVPLTTGIGVLAVTAGRRLEANASPAVATMPDQPQGAPNHAPPDDSPAHRSQYAPHQHANDHSSHHHDSADDPSEPGRASRGFQPDPAAIEQTDKGADDADEAPPRAPRRGAAPDHSAFRRPD